MCGAQLASKAGPLPGNCKKREESGHISSQPSGVLSRGSEHTSSSFSGLQVCSKVQDVTHLTAVEAAKGDLHTAPLSPDLECVLPLRTLG